MKLGGASIQRCNDSIGEGESEVRERVTNVKYLIFFALAVYVGLTTFAYAQSENGSAPKAAPVSDTTTTYSAGHLASDPRFITYLERNGPCTVPGPPRDNAGLIVPYQIYPAESLRRHEEGTVVEFIFDPGWCVRKATIIKSSKYWRLDYVSLKWAMNQRWTPKKTLLTSEGEPTVTIPIGWGESQSKELRAPSIEPAQSSTQGSRKE